MIEGESPLQVLIPRGARVIQLRTNSKEPASLTGHHAAVTLDLFEQLGPNIGIVLDAQWLAVDLDRMCDEARFLTKRLAETPTWRQKTLRGRHWLFRTPAGWTGTNVKLRDAAGEPYGDIKTVGYIVGPGSMRDGFTYTLEDGREPADAPADLLELALRGDPKTAAMLHDERDSVAMGEQNAFYATLCGWLRRQGFSADTLAHIAPAMAAELFVEQDPRHPWTLAELARKARTFAKYPAGVRDEPLYLLPPTWKTGDDAPIVGEPTEWWVHGLIPKGELVMVYGAGGTGKSSWASWVASEVTQKGGTVAFYGVEEPFVRFLRRAVLGGAQRHLLLDPGPCSALALPRDAKALEAAVQLAGVDVVYFDAITAHTDVTAGLNIAERTRKTLGPLAEIAQRTGATILCTFHENKAGDFGGSVEMLNLARHVLHATRKRGKPLRISVKKTNLLQLDEVAQFEGDEVTVVEPTSGEVQMEEDQYGDLHPAKVKICRQIESITIATLEAETEDSTEGQETRLKGESLRQMVETLMRTEPGIKKNDIAKRLQRSPGSIGRYMAEVNRSLE